MWQPATSRWHDLWWDGGEGAVPRPNESAASYSPLWAGAFSDASQAADATAALNASGLVQAGGVATTRVPSGEQWDWPNAWPPLQQRVQLRPFWRPPRVPQEGVWCRGESRNVEGWWGFP